MREHPEVTSKSAIAKAAGTNRNMVRKYCNEIRSELGLKYAQELRRSEQHKFPLELAPEGICVATSTMDIAGLVFMAYHTLARLLGTVSPVSQRETACRVTCTYSASCSWERPRLVRSSRRASLGSMSITTLSGLYHSRSKKQSNCQLPALIHFYISQQLRRIKKNFIRNAGLSAIMMLSNLERSAAMGTGGIYEIHLSHHI